MEKIVDPLAGLDLDRYLDLSEQIAVLERQRTDMLRAACPAQRGDLVEFKLAGRLEQGRVNYVGVSHVMTSAGPNLRNMRPAWTLNVSRIKRDQTRASHASHVVPEDFVRVIERAPATDGS